MAEYTEEEKNDLEKKKEDEENMVRFLIFVSDGINIAVSTEYVVEIITNHTVTALPMVPEYVRGIINLRGQIIPVIDIRLRMGKQPGEYTEKTCMIVLEAEDMEIGIIVDEVRQVMDIDVENILPVPEENRQELINGMITVGEKEVLMFLDCREMIQGC